MSSHKEKSVVTNTQTELMETITWIPAENPPDCDLTVICLTEDGYFCGWWDDERGSWFDSTGMPVAAPLYYCTPMGPKT